MNTQSIPSLASTLRSFPVVALVGVLLVGALVLGLMLRGPGFDRVAPANAITGQYAAPLAAVKELQAAQVADQALHLSVAHPTDRAAFTALKERQAAQIADRAQSLPEAR
jgi:hypothetical protein